jgi:hypothetical protein
MRSLKIAWRDAYFLQLSKTVRFDRLFLIETSPRQAERSADLEPALRINFWATKNPAASAGRIRPSLESLPARGSKTDVLEARFLSTRYS